MDNDIDKRRRRKKRKKNLTDRLRRSQRENRCSIGRPCDFHLTLPIKMSNYLICQYRARVHIRNDELHYDLMFAFLVNSLANESDLTLLHIDTSMSNSSVNQIKEETNAFPSVGLTSIDVDGDGDDEEERHAC